MFSKIEKKVWAVYEDLYKLCGEDFNEILEKDRDFWFEHYYLPQEDFEKVLKKHLRWQKPYVKQAISANVYLGCSPCSTDFYYELTKEDSPSFFKSSSRVKWIQYKDDATYESWFTLPEVGRCLVMSPFDPGASTWQTTPVLEYSFEGKDTMKFKTKNSNYILTRKLKKD